MKEGAARVLWPFLMFLVLGVAAVYFGPYRIKHQKCLRFGTQVVRLSGRISKRVFSGVGENTKKANKPETYWALHLDSSICAQDEPGDYWSAMEDIKDIQLDFENYKKYQNLFERGKVTVQGVLQHTMVGPQYMSVVIHVEEITAMPN